MQVYSQTSTSTTLPRSPSAVSGAEFTQRSALSVGSLFAAPTRLEPATMTVRRIGRMALMKRHSKVCDTLRSKSVHVDDRGGERLRGFLWQVVPDTARQVSVFVFA